jgi:hypothetical protein
MLDAEREGVVDHLDLETLLAGRARIRLGVLRGERERREEQKEEKGREW